MGELVIPIPRSRSLGLRAYVATPTTGSGPWPGVVVLHDALGFTRDVRANTNRLADAGYIAVAPHLYSAGQTVSCIQATFRSLVANGGSTFDDIDAVRRWLIERDDCTGRVGVIGFCMGGGFALLCSTRGFDVSAPNYPVVAGGDLDELLKGACPIVASYGAKDRLPGMSGAAVKLRGTLERAQVPHDLKEYPDAGHSFMNQHSRIFQGVGRVFGIGYHAPSAEDAWGRVLRFFEERLMPRGGPPR
jgi:carboxymethylenebutenolidase